MKAAIFVDSANVSMSGGHGTDYKVMYKWVQSLGTVIRANLYLPVDEEAEKDEEVRRRRTGFRWFLQKNGWKIIPIKVRRFNNEDGTITKKSDSDVTMAVDALVQTEGIDLVILATGDGDFVRLVQALQDKGKRVELLNYENASAELRRTVDFVHDAYEIPGLVPEEEDDRPAPSAVQGAHTGFIHAFDEVKGFGFMTSGDNANIFVHYKDVRNADGTPATKTDMVEMRNRRSNLSFDVQPGDNGRFKAINVREVIDSLQ